MSKILVTGGAGFIGSHLVHELTKSNQVVVILRDIFPSPWSKWLEEALKGCIVVSGDILNEDLVGRVISTYAISHVVHLACQAIVKTAVRNPLETLKVNALGTAKILELCRQLEVDRTFILSTDKIYGEGMGKTENDPLIATGIYETSKTCQDFIAQTYMDTYGLDITIGRACNVYGYDKASRIVSNTIRSCILGEPPIIYQGEEETKRQYIYVRDLVSAIKFLMLSTVKKGIFNIATDDILTQEQVVRKICNYFPLTPKLVKRDKSLKEIQKQSVNWNKLKALGWKPKHSFEEGIKLTIERFEKYGGY